MAASLLLCQTLTADTATKLLIPSCFSVSVNKRDLLEHRLE